MAWKTICGVENVDAGSMHSTSVDGTEFLVLRHIQGDILVIPPLCPHMTAQLCEGFFDGEVLTCAKHLWQWSALDGSKMGVAEAPLLVYPSRINDGRVEVDFEAPLRYEHEEDGA